MSAKHFIINYCIYPFDLLVSIHESEQEVIKILKKRLPDDVHKEIEDLPFSSEAFAVMFSSGQSFIRFLYKPTQGLIAHESLHAVAQLMNRIGNEDVNEAWNYLLQYIVTQINNNL